MYVLYLINFVFCEELIFSKFFDVLMDEFECCYCFGIDGFVLYLGVYCGYGIDVGIECVVKLIDRVFVCFDWFDMFLLFENMVG